MTRPCRRRYRGGKAKVGFALRRESPTVIRYDVNGDWYRSDGRLEAQPRGEGSHVVFRSDAKWHGMGVIMKLFMKGMLEKAVHEDMREHLRLMDEDRAKAPW